MSKPVLSLCMPTNGISEWVFPALDSIYSQDVNTDDFEVIVTNNGNDENFHNRMVEYTAQHNNLIYQKTTAYLFANQLEALSLAQGEYLKFLNHRSILQKGALKQLIRLVQDNQVNKPVIYFSCGALQIKTDDKVLKCDDFDAFIANLRRHVSWTTGVGIWKEDYDRIPKDFQYDKISPHSGILFAERHKSQYLINDFLFAKDIDSSHAKKGKYDLFKAFAVEEPAILTKLFIDGDISSKTLKIVLNDYKKFVGELYLMFCIFKRPCSYTLTGFDDTMGIYFSRSSIYLEAVKCALRGVKSKIARKVGLK